MAVTLAGIIGFTAGALVIGVGALILSVAPRSRVHRFFFAFALADGLSTCAFRLRDMVASRDAPLLMTIYFATYIVFVGLLLVFGLTFPRPSHDTLSRRVLVLAGGAMTAAFVLHLVARGLFWRAQPDGSFAYEPGGALVQGLFVLAVAILLARSTRLLLGQPSEGHRRQTALVLGGIALGYGPFATTSLIAVLASDPSRMLVGRVDIVLARWTYVVTSLALVAVAALVAWRGSGASRRIALACFGGVAFLTLVSSVATDATMLSLLRAVGLLAYPLLVALAILRFGLFQVETHKRRVMLVASVLTVLGAASIVGQFAFELVLAPALASPFDSQLAGELAASFVAAGLAVPVTTLVRRGLARIAPPPESPEFHGRRLDFYKHSVEGVLLDGARDLDSSSVLRHLRESLGISLQEHERVVAALAQ